MRRHTIDVRPLRHPPYRRLFIGNAVSNLGYQFTAVAVPVQMYALTASSLWVGLLGVAGLVPLIVFAVWGGAVADAVDRRRLLLASSALMWSATFAFSSRLCCTGTVRCCARRRGADYRVRASAHPAEIVPRRWRAEIRGGDTPELAAFNAAMVVGRWAGCAAARRRAMAKRRGRAPVQVAMGPRALPPLPRPDG